MGSLIKLNRRMSYNINKIWKTIFFKAFVKINKLESESEYEYKYRKDIFRYYYVRHKNKLTGEEKYILKYLKKNTIRYFPYKFDKKYNNEIIKVEYDGIKKLRYVMHKGNKLYFKKKWDENKIISYYNFLKIEQDYESPHCYFNNNLLKKKYKTVIDAGTAEGNFALEIIDRAERIYLFEPDEDWIQPLKATFEPWKGKIIIINKYLGNKNKETIIKLDDFIKENIDLLKIDVEGEEINVLKGAEKIIKEHKPIILCCTYHKPFDSQIIYDYLSKSYNNPKYSRGMIIYIDDPRPPYFRKVLLTAS